MNSSSAPGTGTSYEATVAHLRRVLVGFVSHYGDTQLSEKAYRLRVPPSKLPLANLARQIMVIFGAPSLGG